jgi:hypothetical protein
MKKDSSYVYAHSLESYYFLKIRRRHNNFMATEARSFSA